MASDRMYTPSQVAKAATELREAAGAGEEYFTAEQVIDMLSEEIRLLRERGFSDSRIADLLSGFDIDVNADDVAQNSADNTELR